ncbi:MAG TPA: 3-dehydroquinate synthase family protein [Acidimicrobiales bacterium]|nr:3-dehydroquinate synthase family protein [Acidimicrobiales bacterium]
MRINVALSERSYDVYVGAGVRRELAATIARLAPRARRAAFVTSTELLTQPWFDFESGIAHDLHEIPNGERAKTTDSYLSLVEAFARSRLSRDDLVVAVGGGAITDVAGFAAATYLRGVALINVATTVAGQVDAAIGGKTGINLPDGKNLVGAFHQPLAVFCDYETLDTLPERERRAGMGEIAKCVLLESRDQAWLERATFEEQVELALSLKARIVSDDEFEGGARALLNYGHTLGHALERESLARNIDALRHGEAVAIGLAFAARLARDLGRVDDQVVAAHDAVLAGFALPSRVPNELDTSALLDAMAHDKKAHHDLTFVLAGAQGFSVVAGVAPEQVRDALERFRGEP